jgi:hypothetical protein
MPHPNWSQSDEVTGVDFQPDRLVGERGECVDHDVTAELRLLIGHSHFDVAESLVPLPTGRYSLLSLSCSGGVVPLTT